MTVRHKAILLVVAVFLASIVILHVVTSLVLVAGFRHLEDEELLDDLEEAQAAIDRDVEQLVSATSDWARWDEAYDFVRHGGEEFIRENLLDQTFRNLRLNAVIFVERSGRVTFAKGFDLEADRAVPVMPVLLEMAAVDGELTRHAQKTDIIAGLISTPAGPMLVASLPILPSDMEGESRGWLIWARHYDRAELSHLPHLAELALSIEPLALGLADGLEPGQRAVVHPVDAYTLAGYRVLRDVTGRPQWVLHIRHPRQVYQQGLTAIRCFVAVLLVAGVAFGLVMLLVTDRLILRRLESLGAQMEQIGKDGQFTGRVTLHGSDELSTLAGTINGLLHRLEQSVIERVSLEKQVREVQKAEAVGRLAGGIAHDFNNILTAVMGYCGQLGRRHRLEPAAAHCVGEIEKLSDRAATLTRQLLAFGRRQVLQPRVLDLNELVRNTQPLIRPMLGESVELVMLLEEELGCVKADPAQFEQVLINLALNARDALPAGGKLVIQTRNLRLTEADAAQRDGLPPGEYAVLRVADTGVGMSAEVKEHLFEPFYTTKEVGQGAGLGLATCYGIVKQSGGDIRVESEPGQGTTVTIYLPQVADRPMERDAAPPDSAAASRGTETVMVVEDEPAVREMSVGMLRDLGYQVMEAANGEEALRLADRSPEPRIDLLLTDMVMPLMGGQELAANFLNRYPRTKVLFTSGYVEAGAVRGRAGDEPPAFLPKPFTSNMLALKVREVLGAAAASDGI